MSTEAEVEEVLRTFASRFESRDLPGISALFAQDDRFAMFGTQANLYIVGWPGMEASLKRQFEVLEDISLVHREARVRVLAGGEAASATALVSFRSRIGDERRDSDDVRATYTLERIDGRFRIVHIHWSVPRVEVLVRY